MAPCCPHCRAPLQRPQAQFCHACGRPLSAASHPGPAWERPRDGALSYIGSLHGTQHLSLPQLTIRWQGGRAQIVPLTQEVVTVGREPANDLVVDSNTVSRQHARLERRGGITYVTDLGSRNGTTLNGRPLAPNVAQPLAHGAVLRIGDTAGNSVSLTFEDGSAPAGPIATRPIRLPEPIVQGRATLTLGRDPSCDVPLPAPTVSWHHAQIDPIGGANRAGNGGGGGAVVVRDLGSTNGTFVNGQKIRVQPVNPGDRIQIGPFQLIYRPSGLAQVGSAQDYSLDGVQLRRQVPDREKKGTLKLILNDVSVAIRPREFVALVGGSGAGKTTLMNALSGFKRADGGQVLVNGDDLYQNYGLYRTQMGYVPQDDTVHSGLPVNHALRYAARLRLPPDTTLAEIDRRIEAVLTSVGMAAQEKQSVSSLSGGQRKRVNIGLELLAEPGLFFLDEPTSGLDPGLEKRMMDTLRRLSDEGRTIVLVTHATANIALCDLVAFMAQGRLVFFGPPDEAKRFFGGVEFADIYTILEPPSVPGPPGTGGTGNPRPDLQQVAGQWEARFKADRCCQQYVASRQAGIQPAGRPRDGALSSPARRGSTVRGGAAPVRQFAILAHRYLELVLRDRMSLVILLAVMPVIGFLLLLIGEKFDLIGAPASEITRQMDATGSYRVAGRTQTLLLMMSLAGVLLGLFGAAYEIVKEWPIYRRERMINLGIVPYLASKVLVLMGFAVVQCLALLIVLSIKIDLPHKGVIMSAPVEMYVTMLLGTLTSIALGLFISALARSQNMVIYVIMVVIFVQIIFAGVLFDLPQGTKPLSYLTVTRWTVEPLGATVDMERLKGLGKSHVTVPGDPALGTPDSEIELEDDYEFKINYDRNAGHLLSRWAILLGFATLWLGLTGVTLRRRDEI